MSKFLRILLFAGITTLWLAEAQFELIINSNSLPDGIVNNNYSATVSSNGSASTTWDLAGGSFPPGIGIGTVMGSSTTLTGTPSASGNFTFTLGATDPQHGNAKATQQFTISVAQISPASPLPAATVNAPYSVTFTISPAQTFTWSVQNAPPGLTMSTQGVLSGSPTLTGTFAFNVTATPVFSDFGQRSPNVLSGALSPRISGPVTATYQLTVAPGLVFTSSVTLPKGVAGMNYSFTLTASGGTPPYSFSVEPSGAIPNMLPANLTLSAGGLISGIPTTAGDYGFAVDVTDANGVVTSAFLTLIIAPPLSITTASPLPTATLQSAYTQSVAATGGNTPYTFSVAKGSTLPTGITLQSNGSFTGTPTVTGSFTFTLQVTDAFGYLATKVFQITVAPAGPLLSVSPLMLTFSGAAGDSDSPPKPQIVSIVAPSGAPANYAAQLQGTPPPPWITIAPVSGSTPGALSVTVSSIVLNGSAAPTTLAPGSYTATIQITVPGNPGQAAISVQVTFTVTAKPTLLVVPTVMRFGARASQPSTQEQLIEVEDTGGGGAVSATVVGKSTWITLPQSAIPATVRVDVNSQGLGAGNFHDIVRLTNQAGTVDVSVSLFVSSAGPIMSLGVTGLTFSSRQGAGSTDSELVSVLNLGDPTSTVNWTVDLVSGSNWLTIVPPGSGTATPSQPGTFALVPSANIANLPAGPQYALVRVTDPQSQNSPQYLTAVLNNQPATSPALPDPGPAGLFFLASTGAQAVVVSTSSTTPVPFQASAVTADGAAWLSVTPATGTASSATPGQLSVSIHSSVVGPGIYHGSINIAMNGALRIVNVTLVVPSATTPPSIRSSVAAAASCTPAHIAITQSGLANNFAVPAGWPATLIVQLNDDCGNPISNGSVVASFSNGDAPLTLPGDHTTNIYSSTWQPGAVFPEMTVTIQASASSLPQAVQQFTGGVNQNTTPAPSLIANGALNIFFDTPTANAAGRALAPGGVIQIYGNGLAAALTSPGVVPLLNAISGTFLLIGKYQVPLFFVDGIVVAAQVPFEITPNQQYPVIASVNNALTLPETVDIVSMQPGVLFYVADQTVVAQRLDGSLVSASAPAMPGETLTLYLAGMGATNPPVASGVPTPLQKVPANTQPLVTLGGEMVNVGYAGLTPTGVGLYQINFTVPNDAPAGLLDLVITQGTVAANTTKLIVGSK